MREGEEGREENRTISRTILQSAEWNSAHTTLQRRRVEGSLNHERTGNGNKGDGEALSDSESAMRTAARSSNGLLFRQLHPHDQIKTRKVDERAYKCVTRVETE